MNKKLKKLRENARLTQSDAASALGVGQSAISMWETGESVPKTEMIPKIAEVYGCTISELFSKDN